MQKVTLYSTPLIQSKAFFLILLDIIIAFKAVKQSNYTLYIIYIKYKPSNKYVMEKKMITQGVQQNV